MNKDQMDAMRYQKLRSLAVDWNDLEATVALGMFDFTPTPEEFDAKVDALQVRSEVPQ